jgi:hypothetical protein
MYSVAGNKVSTMRACSFAGEDVAMDAAFTDEERVALS